MVELDTRKDEKRTQRPHVLSSKKNVFWEALIVTIAVFMIGLFLGIMIEANNANEITQLSILSEISLSDANALATLIGEGELSCEQAKTSSIAFANNVYEEAKQLEQFEEAGKLTDNLQLLHKKYDLLRTILWMSASKTLDECNNFDMVVYLYEYESEDLDLRATQNVWSKILSDLKEGNENMLLIPIAADQGLESLEALKSQYNIESLPALVVNNNDVLYALESKETISALFSS